MRYDKPLFSLRHHRKKRPFERNQPNKSSTIISQVGLKKLQLLRSEMPKISRRIEIIAFRRRTQVAAGSNPDANSSSPDKQSGEPAVIDVRSLLPEDTSVNADVVRLLKQIAASLDYQADGDE